jgi:hypothetical protein
MRTWGRNYNEDGTYQWVLVQTDNNGFSDMVWLTTLCQALKLNLGESPFNSNYGIPTYQSLSTQVAPDYYVMQTQTQFAPYFASLTIQKVAGIVMPTYNITAVCHSGAILTTSIAV